MNLENFDIFILLLFSCCGVLGLIRGFIKEILSIINWILSFYIVSILKPIFLDNVSELIKIPFLSDIILNLVIFALTMIILSIISRFVSTTLRKIVPYDVNAIFGFVIGIIKAFIILFLVVSTVRIVHNNDNPKVLQDSIFNQLFFRNDIINEKIKILLGDFISEKKDKIKTESIENIEDRYKDVINKKNIDIIEKKIDDFTENQIVKDNIKNLDNEIENILEKL